MKRYIGILVLSCMLAIGIIHDIPAAISADKTYWQQFMKQDVMYKSWDHFWFSVWGYRHPVLSDVKRSERERWWGDPIEVKK